MKRDNDRPLIVITNDDGIASKGLAFAAAAASQYGDVLIAAPDRQQTAMGRSYPRTPDLGIIEKRMIDTPAGPMEACAVHASPAHTAAYAIMEIADRKPDLLISGINYGLNVGMSVTGSGTIGACMEAVSEGVPSVALSLEVGAGSIMTYSDVDFSWAGKAAAFWTERMLSGKESSRFLSVNIPSGQVQPENFRYAPLDPSNYYVFVQTQRKNWSQPYTLKFTIEDDAAHLERGSDAYTVCVDRMCSVTPLTIDVTDYVGMNH